MTGPVVAGLTKSECLCDHDEESDPTQIGNYLASSVIVNNNCRFMRMEIITM
jgi:hypothetical protein